MIQAAGKGTLAYAFIGHGIAPSKGQGRLSKSPINARASPAITGCARVRVITAGIRNRNRVAPIYMRTGDLDTPDKFFGDDSTRQEPKKPQGAPDSTIKPSSGNDYLDKLENSSKSQFKGGPGY